MLSLCGKLELLLEYLGFLFFYLRLLEGKFGLVKKIKLRIEFIVYIIAILILIIYYLNKYIKNHLF